MKVWRSLFAVAVVLVTAAVAHAQVEEPGAGPVYPHFYIGVDRQSTFTSGAYAGLPNPNFNRLTFLYGHSYEDYTQNHFHSIGVYTYAGPNLGAATQVLDTSAGNRIPEVYRQDAGVPPLSLLPGTGVYSGFLRSGLAGIGEYEGFRMQSVRSLSGTGDPNREALFDNFANPRYRSSLGDAQIALELVSLSDGFLIGDALGNVLLSAPGDLWTIGVGDSLAFEPVFFTSAAADPGRYSAEFRLRDRSGSLGDSGRFSFDFQVTPEVIPEPGTLSLLAATALPGLGLAVRLRRREKAA